MKTTQISDRMKNYENIYKYSLTPLMPVILRIDGKAFHTFTRGHIKPFDTGLIDCMTNTAKELVKNIQGAKFGYVQSDEISIVLIYYNNRDSAAWFANELQKMVSISASMATGYFNYYYRKEFENDNKMAFFDSRAFCIPEFDVVNYFIWRQRDWQKNSIQMLARHYFSQKELLNKNGTEMIEMLLNKRVDYYDLQNYLRMGIGIVADGGIDYNIPEFTKNREYITDKLKNFTNE